MVLLLGELLGVDNRAVTQSLGKNSNGGGRNSPSFISLCPAWTCNNMTPDDDEDFVSSTVHLALMESSILTNLQYNRLGRVFQLFNRRTEPASGRERAATQFHRETRPRPFHTCSVHHVQRVRSRPFASRRNNDTAAFDRQARPIRRNTHDQWIPFRVHPLSSHRLGARLCRIPPLLKQS